MSMAIGNLATGHDSIVRLKEEYDFATLGTNTNFIDLRRNAHKFGLKKNSVKMGSAASNELGYAKETTKFATGRFAFQFDIEFIGWLLKGIMGSNTTDSTYSVTSLTTAGYKHTFKFGNKCKTFTIYENKGAMDTAYYQKSSGMFPINLSFLYGMTEVLNCTTEWVGKTCVADDSTATSGAITYTADDKMVPYNGVSYYTKASGGEEDIADMTQWKDPFDFDLSIIRQDAEVKNWSSDGTGLPTAVYAGVPGVALSITAIMKSADGSTIGHKLADYVAGNEFAFGIVLDSGKTGLGAGGTTTYKMEVVFPRVRFEDYDIRLSAGKEAACQIPIEVMKDPTLGYSMAMILYNNTATYPDATA